MNAGPRLSAAIAATVLAVLTQSPTPTGAATEADGNAPPSEADATLASPTQLVRWTGQFHETGPSVEVPLPCLEDLCDDFWLAVDLPPGIWSRAGGVQIGVQASRGAVHLYVYDEDGRTVAKSNSETVGNATVGDVVLGHDNSVMIDQATNGLYRVVVVSPSPVHAEQTLQPVTYDGIAEVEFAPTEDPVRDLLPNLVPLPTTTARIPNGTGSGLVLIEPEEGFQAGGCLLDEMVEDGARKCLRFESQFANVGDGPYQAEVRHQLDGSSQVWQRVFHSDGGDHERFVGDAKLHVTHGHFHVADLAVNRLWRSNASGDKLGPDRVREGQKTGFCHGDTDNVWFGRKGDAARTYLDGSSCFGLSAVPPTSSQGPFGISVGWADTYGYGISGQYIEVSGVPDGYYLLESEINPLDTVAESDDSDNTISVLIRLCGEKAELVGKENRCSS